MDRHREWAPLDGVTCWIAERPGSIATTQPPEDSSSLPSEPGVESDAARDLLRTLLMRVTRRAPAGLVIRPAAGGRPIVDGLDQTWVSLSHSGGELAVVVSTVGPVGVDVQVPRRIHEALARRVLAPDLFAAWEALPPAAQALAFADTWVVLEACHKARGTGLPARIDPVTVPFTGSQGRLLGCRWWRRPSPRSGWPLAVALLEQPDSS